MLFRSARRLARSALFACANAQLLAACLAQSSGSSTPANPLPTETPPASTMVTELSRVPVADAYLDRKFHEHGGLLNSLDVNGKPVTVGAAMDPVIQEGREFYAGLEAPMTLTDWKTRFGFPERQAGESLQDYRDRAGIAVYYNQWELGLGRELGCSQFVDGTTPTGQPVLGTACFVTNYGATFRDQHNSLRLAADGSTPKNTVCISYRPSMEESYQIQFYVYNADGNRQEWAQLDGLGPRPAPRICMNCHGGTYDESRNLARWARFLPVDPNMVVFAEGDHVPHGLTREGQEERMRAMNALALHTPLAPEQRELFLGLYDGKTEQPGQTAVRHFVPAGWSKDQRSKDLYREVVKPFCGTCHFAEERGLDGTRKWFYEAFNDYDVFKSTPMLSWVCNRFEMPNAQPTMIGFWSTERGDVIIDGKTYASAADALLDVFGATRESCTGWDVVSDCRRGGDDLCGNAHSGTACDRRLGVCVPSFPAVAPTDPREATGVCKTDGSRRCGSNQECRPEVVGTEGYDGACYTCGVSGFPPCEMTSFACRDGLTLDASSMCAPM